MKKTVKYILPFFLLTLLLFACFFWMSRDLAFQILYDWTHHNPPIETKGKSKKILTSFETISYKKLDAAYLEHTLSNQAKFKKMLSEKRYYKIDRSQMYQYIVGKHRLKQFLSKDSYYKASLFDKSKQQYWLINERLLYRILELQNALKEMGHNSDAFTVRSGHRTPQRNKQVEGAGSSRHIVGEAADLVIGDINMDGRFTQDDKAIVLKLVDERIIAHRGGVGRYPGSRVVHIDVRGRRARWDTY